MGASLIDIDYDIVAPLIMEWYAGFPSLVYGYNLCASDSMRVCLIIRIKMEFPNNAV